MPRRIEFKRDPNYWGKALPMRRGYFNFDRIVYVMYQDDNIALEAFKAGDFDLLKEYSSRSWVRRHQGVKWRDGRILKDPFPVDTGQGLQSLQLNLRRPKFQDIRVREALVLAWDFEQYNSYRTFKHAASLFNNTEYAAQGLPSAAELALLEPYRAELPARVFGPAFVPPTTASGPNGLRDNLRRARDLLSQAGWKIASDGKLRNAAGDAFEIEVLLGSRSDQTMWQRNLAKLGIDLKERLVDYALYHSRLQAFDFDVTVIAGRPFTLPPVAELRSTFHSSNATAEGSNNLRGLQSKAVDRLLELMGEAGTKEELVATARALDRVVMWGFYQVPTLFKAEEQASYWNKFGIPSRRARYFSIDTWHNNYGLPWPLWTWWDKSLESPAAAPRTPSAPR